MRIEEGARHLGGTALALTCSAGARTGTTRLLASASALAAVAIALTGARGTSDAGLALATSRRGCTSAAAGATTRLTCAVGSAGAVRVSTSVHVGWRMFGLKGNEELVSDKGRILEVSE